jgi:hypothetical protein
MTNLKYIDGEKPAVYLADSEGGDENEGDAAARTVLVFRLVRRDVVRVAVWRHLPTAHAGAYPPPAPGTQTRRPLASESPAQPQTDAHCGVVDGPRLVPVPSGRLSSNCGHQQSELQLSHPPPPFVMRASSRAAGSAPPGWLSPSWPAPTQGCGPAAYLLAHEQLRTTPPRLRRPLRRRL